MGVVRWAADTGFHDLDRQLETEFSAQGFDLLHQGLEIVIRDRPDLDPEHPMAGGDVVDPGLSDIEVRETR